MLLRSRSISYFNI